MSSRSTRGAGAENGTAKGSLAPKKIIEIIKEATGAAEEDITTMLMECNYDVNETTNRLIDNPFSQVQSKKAKRKKKEEERRKDGSKVLEVRRPAAGAAGRGRSGRGGVERAGLGTAKGVPPAPPQKPGASEFVNASGAPQPPPLVTEDVIGEALPPQSSPQKMLYSRAPGQNYIPPAVSQTESARSIGTGGSTMADLFKRPPGTATTPPQQQSSSTAVNASDQEVKPVAPTSTIGPVKPVPSLDVGGTLPTQSLPTTDSGSSGAFTTLAPSTSAMLSLTSEDANTQGTHVATSQLPTSTATVDVPVSAPARPAFQPSLQANTGRSNVWKAAGPAQQSLAGSLMSAIGAGNSQAVKATESGGLSAPTSVAASTPGVVSDLHDTKSSVILPPSAQVTDTERIRLQFGQFSIGTDFSSSLSAALSIDQPEPESSTLGQNVTAQDRQPQPPVSSTPLMFKTATGSVDYNSNARAYSAFSQPPIQPPPPKPDSVLPDAGGSSKVTESTAHGTATQYYGTSGQNPHYQQYLSSQHSSSHYPSSQYQQYDHGLDSHASHTTTETAKPTAGYEHHSSYTSYQGSALKTATDYSGGKYGSHQNTQTQVTVPASVANAESTTGMSTTPATTQLQPPLPQMQGAYTNPAAMPPGMAQYGHMYAQYGPAMFNMTMPPSAYYAMPPSAYSPYPPQGAAFGAPHQSSSTYHGTSSYPSHANPATAPRFPPYNPAGSSVGFSKDKEGSLYAPQSQAQQLQQGVPGRENLYSYNVPGQGYQGYGAHSSQYSSYGMSQYAPNPYSQMPQGGAPGQVNSYKLQ